MRLACAGAWALLAAWSFGQVARDATLVSGLCFYLPSPVLAAGLLGLAVLLRLRGEGKSAALYGLAALAPLLFTLGVETRWQRAERPAQARTQAPTSVVRVVHWNVARGMLGIDQPAAKLRSWDADLLVLSEVPRRQTFDAYVQRLGPEYASARLGSIMAVFCRGTLTVHRSTVTDDLQSGFFRCAPKTAGGARGGRRSYLDVLAFDVTSDPGVARDPLLRKIRRQMVRLRPDLVVGDFNSPRRSTALSPLPPGYGHAYDLAGRGWGYTWPTPLPFLAIDHCLVSERVDARLYLLDTAWGSDHRLQFVEVGVP